MSSLPKRKISELILIYQTESSLKDLYTEGNTDKYFYEYFLEKVGIEDIRCYSIDMFEFDQQFYIEDLSNRNKVIKLSEILLEEFKDTLQKVSCVIDKDTNDVYREIDENYYLFITDFTSIEMYLFNEKCIDKFLRLGLNGFPLNAKGLLAIFENLQHIFIVHCAKIERHKNAQKVNLDSCFTMNLFSILTGFDFSE